MIEIKNLKELNKLLYKNKNLFVKDDVKIMFQLIRGDLNDINCYDLTLKNEDGNYLDFNGWNFNGNDFIGNNFIGNEFIGSVFIGNNFNGNDFIGREFNGNDISYHGVFIAYNNINCTSIKGRRHNSIHKALDGKITIRKKK